MQGVGHGFAEQTQIPVAEGFRNHNNTADVMHCIFQGHLFGQGGSGLLGGEMKLRKGNRDMDGRIMIVFQVNPVSQDPPIFHV